MTNARDVKKWFTDLFADWDRRIRVINQRLGTIERLIDGTRPTWTDGSGVTGVHYGGSDGGIDCGGAGGGGGSDGGGC